MGLPIFVSDTGVHVSPLGHPQQQCIARDRGLVLSRKSAVRCRAVIEVAALFLMVERLHSFNQI